MAEVALDILTTLIALQSVVPKKVPKLRLVSAGGRNGDNRGENGGNGNELSTEIWSGTKEIDRLSAEYDKLEKQIEKKRTKLNKLEEREKELISKCHNHLNHVMSLNRILKTSTFQYVEAPKQNRKPSYSGEGIPSLSGVYFIREKGEIIYVGEAKNIQLRVTLAHEKITQKRRISWLICPPNKRKVMESLYIGIYRPRLNGVVSGYDNGEVEQVGENKYRKIPIK